MGQVSEWGSVGLHDRRSEWTIVSPSLSNQFNTLKQAGIDDFRVRKDRGFADGFLYIGF